MKLWYKIALSILLGIPLMVFAAYWANEISDMHAQEERYAVYSAYLTQGLQTNDHDFGDGHGLLVILDHSVKATTGAKGSLRRASSSMRLDLVLHNLRTTHFEAKFSLPTEYKLVSSDKLLGETGGLQDLSLAERRRSFGGFITLSRISFDRSGTMALFYTEHLACGLCGGGDLVLMQKQNGQWKMIDDYSPWVS
jgi:hypothetical protein